jgi:hypothetical protein
MKSDAQEDVGIYEVGPAAIQPFLRSVWGAILVGTVVTLALHVTLDLLGAGVGFGLIPNESDVANGTNVRDFAVGAGIWWLATTVVSVFAGALVGGKLLRVARNETGALQGLATWALSTVIWVAAMTTVMGGVLAGTMGAMDGSMAVIEARQASIVQGSNPNGVRTQNAQDGLRAEGASPVSQEDARRAAKAAAAAAFWGFLGLILSAGAGCAGGVLGNRPRKLVEFKAPETGPRRAT